MQTVDALVIVLLVAILVIVAFTSVAMLRRRSSPAAALMSPEETDRVVGTVVATLRGELSQVQSQALQANNEQFLALARERLTQETKQGDTQLKARKEEIDRGLKELREELGKVRTYVEQTDKQRGQSMASIEAVVGETRKVTQALGSQTESLNRALAGGQSRGQWGERMAEDVLRAAGFIEGVQYRKQSSEMEGRPDFTFLLPENRVLHMDVKFPGAAYQRYINCKTEIERQAELKTFLRDVRQRIKEITTRDYIDPANGTLDYALVFIPNEQVYGFIHEHDTDVLDFALSHKIVVCSPLTLFAILAVMRQSTDNFRLAKQSGDILKVLGEFNKKWQLFKGGMDTVDKHLDNARKSYDTLLDTRTRMLDVQVKKVETLRTKSGIDAAVAADEIVADEIVEGELVEGDVADDFMVEPEALAAAEPQEQQI